MDFAKWRPAVLLRRALGGWAFDSLIAASNPFKFELGQEPDGLSALTSFGFDIAGRVIPCSEVGRLRLAMAGSSTEFPISADRYKARMIRTSASPSTPDGSGSLFFRMQSEK